MSDAHDPYDYSRSLVRNHAHRAASYAEVLASMAELRDDESAVSALLKLIYEVRLAGAATELLRVAYLARLKLEGVS